MNKTTILKLAALLGAFSVMIGAFGAHALKDLLEESGRVDTFDTAVKYQFYHVFALLGIGGLKNKLKSRRLSSYASIAFIVGILLFSGSLYILCLTNITSWAIVTPFGGLAFIAGWVLFFFSIKKDISN